MAKYNLFVTTPPICHLYRCFVIQMWSSHFSIGGMLPGREGALDGRRRSPGQGHAVYDPEADGAGARARLLGASAVVDSRGRGA